MVLPSLKVLALAERSIQGVEKSEAVTTTPVGVHLRPDDYQSNGSEARAMFGSKSLPSGMPSDACLMQHMIASVCSTEAQRINTLDFGKVPKSSNTSNKTASVDLDRLGLANFCDSTGDQQLDLATHQAASRLRIIDGARISVRNIVGRKGTDLPLPNIMGLCEFSENRTAIRRIDLKSISFFSFLSDSTYRFVPARGLLSDIRPLQLPKIQNAPSSVAVH